MGFFQPNRNQRFVVFFWWRNPRCKVDRMMEAYSTFSYGGMAQMAIDPNTAFWPAEPRGCMLNSGCGWFITSIFVWED